MRGFFRDKIFHSSIKKTGVNTLYKIIICIIFLLPNILMAQEFNDSVFSSHVISNFSLIDARANKTTFIQQKKNQKKLSLLLFLSPECPLCQNYSGVINKLYNEYGKKVNFYGIISGKSYSPEAIQQFSYQYNIIFPLLIDDDKKLTTYLRVSVTPQVILLNDECQLLYKGAIDNKVPALGKQRIKATEFYLHDALQQSLSHQTVLIKRTKAVGCRINDY